MTLFCHVGKEVQEFRPLAIQAASTAEVYLAVVSRPSSSRIARIAPNLTEEGRGASAKFIRRRNRGHCLGVSPRTVTASAPDDEALPPDLAVLRMLLAYLAVAHMPRASLFPSRLRRGPLCCKYLTAQTSDTIFEYPCTRQEK